MILGLSKGEIDLLSESSAESLLTCSVYCSQWPECSGVIYSHPHCKFFKSTNTPTTGYFHKISKIKYSNLKRIDDDLNLIVLPLKSPIPPTGYLEIQGKIVSLDDDHYNPHIFINHGGFYPNPVRHDLAFKITGPHQCTQVTYLKEKDFTGYPFDSCPGVDAGGSFTFRMEFPNESNCTMSINGYMATNPLARNYDFETLAIGSMYAVDTVEIKY